MEIDMLYIKFTEGRKLGDLEWLVTYQDGISANGYPSQYGPILMYSSFDVQ